MFEDSTYFNSILTDYAQGAYADRDKSVDLSEIFFPTLPVKEAKGEFDIWEIAPAFTPVNAAAIRDNTPRRIQTNRTTGDYKCKPYAVEQATWKFDEIQASGQKLREHRMRTLLSAYFVTRQVEAIGLANSVVSPSGDMKDWDEKTDVISAIDALCASVVAGTAGQAPNVLLMGRTVWNKLRNHPAVLDRIHGLSFAMPEEGFLSTLSYRGLRLVISDLMAIDPADGKMKEVLAGDLYVLYNQSAPSLSDMSFGKDFSLSAKGPEVISYDEKGLNKVDALYWSSDRKVTNAAAAARLNTTAA